MRPPYPPIKLGNLSYHLQGLYIPSFAGVLPSTVLNFNFKRWILYLEKIQVVFSQFAMIWTSWKTFRNILWRDEEWSVTIPMFSTCRIHPKDWLFGTKHAMAECTAGKATPPQGNEAVPGLPGTWIFLVGLGSMVYGVYNSLPSHLLILGTILVRSSDSFVGPKEIQK